MSLFTDVLEAGTGSGPKMSHVNKIIPSSDNSVVGLDFRMDPSTLISELAVKQNCSPPFSV